MNKLMSGFIALLCLLFFCYFFSGVGGELSLAEFNPINAINGLAFGFAFALGLPIWLSYIFSILILFGIPALVYWGVYRFLSYLQSK